jgi:hypothetical protein
MGRAVIKKRLFGWVALLALVVPLSLIAWAWVTYPSDRTPEGAYLRIMSAVNRGRPNEFFAYTETETQHACYTIRDYRKRARDRVLAAYPEPERTRIAQAYQALAEAPDAADVFGMYARDRAWLDHLRRDMSRIEKVEIQGERATVQTVRGTRYPMRRRENGIWGLTLFTAALVTEAEKVARDAAMVDKAALDYERARSAAH